jgi:hypothetical protein
MVRVDEATSAGVAAPRVPPALFVGLTVAATGGPLALAAIYVPGVLGDARGSSGLVVLLGAAMFVPALGVWLLYSREVAGPGGLYGFVRVAVGRPVALVQAALWVLSYLLYLVYTVTYIVYDLLPSMFPNLTPARPYLQVAVAVLIAAVALLPVRAALAALAAAAAAQVLGCLALAAVQLAHTGAPAETLRPVGDRGALLTAGANTALLFVCASLPLFLAGEVRGGRGPVRRGLAGGWVVAAAATGLAVAPLAVAAPAVLEAPIPGMAAADAAGAHGLATALGVLVTVSVGCVVAAELLALSRLLHALSGRTVASTSRVLAVVLVAGSTVSLVNPDRIYDDLLKVSLVALWLAQVIVFAVYPWFVRRRRRLNPADVALTAAACALMLFGLWSTVTNQIAS